MKKRRKKQRKKKKENNNNNSNNTKTNQQQQQTNNFVLNRLGTVFESVSIAILCLVTETKGQTFGRIPGYYSTTGYTAVRFSLLLVLGKYSYALGQQPS